MKIGKVNEKNTADWLTVVQDNVGTLRFGLVQIVVHDSKVVQIERTERTRFDENRTNNRKDNL